MPVSSTTNRSPRQHRLDAIHALRTTAAHLIASAEARSIRQEARLAWSELNDALAWLERHEVEPASEFLHVIDLELQVAAARLIAAQHLVDDHADIR